MTKVLLDTDKAAVIEAVSGATVTDAGTPASDDKVLIQDTSDSDNLKYVNVSDLPGGGVDVLSNVATARIIGRTTAGSGDSEELTASATRTFLNVEDDADKTDTANVEAAGALMDSEVTNLSQVKAFDSTDYAAALGADDNYVTDAEKTVIGNTSGTNTGDQDLSGLAPKASPTFTGTVAGITATMVGLGNVDNTSNATERAATATLTNKRINKRTSTTTSTATLTPSPANYDVYTLTAQAAALTIANPTGTINIGDTIAIYVTDDATARAISFGTYFKGFGAALPTTTTSGKTLLITAQYYDTNLWSVLSAEIQ